MTALWLTRPNQEVWVRSRLKDAAVDAGNLSDKDAIGFRSLSDWLKAGVSYLDQF